MVAGGAAVAGAGRALFSTVDSSPPAVRETGPVEYAEFCRRLRFDAITASSLPGVVDAMVRIEQASDRFGRSTRSQEDAERHLCHGSEPKGLAVMPVSPHTSPIAHMGYGAGFGASDPAALIDLVSHGASGYSLFLLHGAGFRLEKPPTEELLDQLPLSLHHPLLHGHGRAIAATYRSSQRALNRARSFPARPQASVIQGIAFGLFLMSPADIPSLLEASGEIQPDAARRAFQTGLVYAMAFCDWFVPGILVNWKPASRLEARFIDHAINEAVAGFRREFPLPFRLETPIPV